MLVDERLPTIVGGKRPSTMTINQLKRERVQIFRNVKRELRSLDTILEKLQRFVSGVLNRRTKIPEAEDLVDILETATQLYNSTAKAIQYIETIQSVFM
jgi:hypothetical protein